MYITETGIADSRDDRRALMIDSYFKEVGGAAGRVGGGVMIDSYLMDVGGREHWSRSVSVGREDSMAGECRGPCVCMCA